MLFLGFNKTIKSIIRSLIGLLMLVISTASGKTYYADSTNIRSEISQYGITWTFDRPV